jgi:AcrR family transcriptional regulator
MSKKPQKQLHQARSIAMRERLLSAALDVIYEMGCQGATTQSIAERAKVSRGALLYHFPAREDLIIAAMEELLEDGIKRIKATADDVKNRKIDLNSFVDFLWELFSGKFFYLSLENVTAARIDETLRRRLIPVIKRFHEALDEIWMEFHTSESLGPDQAPVILNLTLCLFRGMGVQTVLRSDPEYYANLLHAWKTILFKIVETRGPHDATSTLDAASASQ